MKRVKLNLSKTNIPLKIQKAKTIVTKMTGNTTFTTPAPSLASITTAISKLESSYELALDGGKTKKATMRTDATALDVLLTQLAAYVQDITAGDELKILSSGMELRNNPSAPQVPETPTDFKTGLKCNEGEARFKWNPVKGAAAYIIQISDTPTDENSWEFYDVITKANYQGGEFVSLTIKWFRVTAVGAKGKSLWSLPLKVKIQ